VSGTAREVRAGFPLDLGAPGGRWAYRLALSFSGLHQMTRKRTHKLKALGNVTAIIAAASTVAEAANALGVHRSSLTRWIAAGKVPHPRAQAESQRTSGRPARGRPSVDRHLMDSRFDPRAVLGMSATELADWEQRRAQWLGRRSVVAPVGGATA
jgi:hypothetical protein